MTLYLNRLLEIFEQLEFKHEEGSINPIQFNHSKSIYHDTIMKTFKELGGIDLTKLKIEKVHLEFRKLGVVLSTDKDFNRYRSKTYRSEFYEIPGVYNNSNQQRYCRQFEPLCKSAASNAKDWSDKNSTLAFGPSEELGDLGLRGSSKWKERAMSSFLLDIACHARGIKILRLSLHDGLLIGGKMTTLKELILKKDERSEKILLNWMKRQIDQL